jgi:glycosyltransferase involved in cell wall biosynthesis
VPDHAHRLPAQPRIRVLLVAARSVGGIGRHVQTIAAGLPGRGVDITICAPKETVAAHSLEATHARIIEAPVGAVSPTALWATRAGLHRAAERVDLVHAHGLRAGAACVGFLPERPLIVTWHNAPLGGRLRRTQHAALARYVASSTDLTLAASDDLAADARAAGCRDVRPTFVAAPELLVSTRSAATIRRQLDLGSRPVVLAVGRLQEQKRFDVLVEAAAAWAGRPNPPVVLIAGEGPERGKLETHIADTNAPVRLLGARTDIADLLEVADVMALPSAWEARALVAQEALRAGVPLVTTGVGGLASLVGDAAMIVPVGDVAALRYAVETVIDNPDRQRRMTELGLARARGWPDEARSLDDLAQTYLDLKDRSRLH